MKMLVLKHSKKATSYLLVLAILLSTVFSAIAVKNVFSAAPAYWDGKIAESFAGGDGSASNPYLIENGGQLYKAVKELGKKNGSAAYYLITADIYLNENYDEYDTWMGDKLPANNWDGVYGNSAFIGHIDGGYHTVYGLFYKGSNQYRAGLIPWMNSGATVENLTIANAFVRIGGDATGVICGRYGDATISNCIIRNSMIYNRNGGASGAPNLGGIVGFAESASAKITNCGVYDLSISYHYGTTGANSGGILGRSSKNNATVSNCYSAGIKLYANDGTTEKGKGDYVKDAYIFGATGYIACSNSHSDIAGNKVGVKSWNNSPNSMKGTGAIANMGLPENIWKDTAGYPILKASDVPSQSWDGKIAASFAGGTGTETDPYLIENGGQLYKAIKELGKNTDGSSAYYLITADIYLNENYDEYDTWMGDTLPANNWDGVYGSSAFIGHIDGGYHTVYGLFYKGSGQVRAGLIPWMGGGATVSNLTIANAFVRIGGDATGVICGRYADATISNCIVRDSMIYNRNGGASGAPNLAGIVGFAESPSAIITNCGVHDLTISYHYGTTGANSGGILGRSSKNNATVSNCYSAGIHLYTNDGTAAKGKGDYVKDAYIFGATGYIGCSNSHSDIAGSKVGVTSWNQSPDSMKGSGAVAKMGLPAIDWKDTDTYPIPYTPNESDNYWDGTTASEFAGGTGIDTDPYLIENASQLYKAISELGKKADGSAAYYFITTDIYINGGYENYASWGSSAPANNWLPASGDFIGHIDGGYHTIYGLYSVTGKWRNGLIPYMNSGATVSNLIIRNAYIHNNDSNAGAITGTMYDNTKVNACLIYDTVVSAGRQDIGGIVGSAAKNTVTISNCGTYNLTLNAPASAGGILGRSWQQVSGANGVRVLNCFSVDNFPVGDTNNLWADATYTNASGTKGGVIKIEKDKMQGAGAVANMKLSASIWIDTDSYPTLSGLSENVGDVWTGVEATRFSGGTGTQSDPYIIETASQLYKAVASLGKGSDGKAAYYSVVADIYLNKEHENYASWGETAPENNWLPINSSVNFIGNIDGNGHTVYGLYTNKAAWCAGLIARAKGGTIRDLNVANSYIYSKGGTVGGIVGMAYAGTTVSRCIVTNTVITDKANTDAGGIVGAAERTVIITACAAYNLDIVSSGAKGGILGRAWSSAQIRECYSVGISPIGGKETNRMGCNNLYTDSNDVKKNGITVVATKDMKGGNALKNMPLISSQWVAISEGYPVLREYYNGKSGEIWSGAIAENYAGGDGTAENPYLIETAEQLYKMVYENCVPGNVAKDYKLTADIRLNNTDGETWYERSDINLWHIVHVYSFSFAGHFDGDGHTVAGIRTASESGNAYAGLFPVLEMGSSVKNVGVIESYIATSPSVAENFSGSIAGWIDDWDSSNPVTPENTPIISNCFADGTVTLSGYYCGGIVSGVAAPVLVENCYFTGGFKRYGSAACIIGNVWTQGSKISHCYAATSGMYSFAGGQSVSKNDLTYEACYNFGKGSGTNFYFVSLYDIRGDKAVETLSELDFENVWRTVNGGTPVLRVFGDGADKFSSTQDVYSTVSFVTNVTGMSIEPMRGIIDSPIELPKPKREGYNFAGWYVYVELQCEYTYDTYPFIDLILYAKWEPAGIAQDFESYPNTHYDLDDDYVYFRPGALNYDGANVHGGNKAIKRLGNSSERQDFLVKYEEELKVGKKYTISFWMMTETEGATGKVSMLNATWPDIAEPVKGKEMDVARYSNLSVGEWKQYKYEFTALTPWVSLRTDGNTVLYFDDILIYPTK